MDAGAATAMITLAKAAPAKAKAEQARNLIIIHSGETKVRGGRPPSSAPYRGDLVHEAAPHEEANRFKGAYLPPRLRHGDGLDRQGRRFALPHRRSRRFACGAT
jgi:hypothetical protein